MPETENRAGGLMTSGRRLAHSVLGLLHARAELFAVELQEEKLRALNLALWLCIGGALVAAAVLLAVATLALFLWRTAGYAGLIGLTLAVVLAAGGILWWLRRRILQGPAPFAETVNEFRKDADSFRPQP